MCKAQHGKPFSSDYLWTFCTFVLMFSLLC